MEGIDAIDEDFAVYSGDDPTAVALMLLIFEIES